MKYNYIFCTVLIALFLSTGMSAEIRARVFRDKCHEGNSQGLYNSSYKMNQLSWVGNDKISSIIVYPGWEVILYEHDNFLGKCYVVSSNMIDLNSVDFNDKVSSIEIVAKTFPPIQASDHLLPDHFLDATSVVAPGTSGTTINKLEHETLKDVTRLHSQGIGWDNITGNYVYTGCRSATNSWGFQQGCVGESHIVLFDSNLDQAIDATISNKYNGENGGRSHPSAIQITNSIFPVAIENEDVEGGCFIEFYQVHQNSLEYLGQDFDVETAQDHIGALAYANVNGNTYMLGATTGGNKIHIWQADGEDNYADLKYLKTIHPFNIADCGVDKNWSFKYQSMWLGKMESGKIVLMAAHGNNHWKDWRIKGVGWIDLWEINSLEPGVQVKLRKLHKEQTTRWGRSHFYEGTTFGPNNRIIVAPNDFTLDFPNIFELKSDMYELRYKWYTWCHNANDPTPAQEEHDFISIATDDESNSTTTANQSDQLYSGNTSVNYFPNPFMDQIKIDVSVFKNESIDGFLTISDLSGVTLKKIKLNQLTMENNFLLLDLRNLADGVYLFTLQNKDFIATQKVEKFNP